MIKKSWKERFVSYPESDCIKCHQFWFGGIMILLWSKCCASEKAISDSIFYLWMGKFASKIFQGIFKSLCSSEHVSKQSGNTIFFTVYRIVPKIWSKIAEPETILIISKIPCVMPYQAHTSRCSVDISAFSEEKFLLWGQLASVELENFIFCSTHEIQGTILLNWWEFLNGSTLALKRAIQIYCCSHLKESPILMNHFLLIGLRTCRLSYSCLEYGIQLYFPQTFAPWPGVCAAASSWPCCPVSSKCVLHAATCTLSEVRIWP